MPKATKAQKNSRTRAVYELLLSDTHRTDIMQYSANNWGLTTRQTDTYISWANDLISEEAARIKTKAFEQHLAKRGMLRHKALKAGDMRLAFEILRDETKLLGLYPAKERTVTNLEVDLGQLTDDQLQRIAQGDDPASVMVDK